MSSPQVLPRPRFRGELQRRLRAFHDFGVPVCARISRKSPAVPACAPTRKTEVTIPRAVNPQTASNRRPGPAGFVFHLRARHTGSRYALPFALPFEARSGAHSRRTLTHSEEGAGFEPASVLPELP